MIILTSLSLLITGILAARYFLGKNGELFERVGIIFFFSISLVPFININLAFINNYLIWNGLTLFLSVLVTVLLLILLKTKTNLERTMPAGTLKSELSAMILLGLVALFFSCYYTNKEFILSLGSYLFKGDAKCFYMQTFENVRGLLSGKHADNNPYGIISTPGNTIFTATFLSIFKVYGFKILYVIFSCLLFIFIYLLTRKLSASEIISLATALFALFNPYALSIEVLDRNIMALAISTLLIYLVLAHKDRIFLHGLVFGVLAGTGLRFLPLLFAIPIAILYYKERLSLRNCLVFICAFFITFTFNLPHLYYHGFQSLGETDSTLSLIIREFTQWRRTPFLPFPNLLFYFFNILNYFGYLTCGIILVGISGLWRKDKRIFWGLGALFFLALLILSCQRNWLEQDKSRILVSCFLPLYVYFAYGLGVIFTKRYTLKKFLLVFICVLLPVIFVRTFSGVDFQQDEGFYKRKFLYQTESRDYYRLSRDFLSGVKMLPNYARLFEKLGLENKRAEEAVIFNEIFATGGLLDSARTKCDYKGWVKPQPLPAKRLSTASYDYVKVDFEKLVNSPESVVKKVPFSPICALDLEAKDNLFDAYYAGLRVGWQKGVLPVSVILRKEEIECLRELYIDLNAFVGLSKDSAGFDIVYPVNLVPVVPSSVSEAGKGMTTFPLFSENNAMVFKIPEGLKIIIRNWFVNEKGAPYKIDSWCIKRDKKGVYKAEFFYDEPESYL